MNRHLERKQLVQLFDHNTILIVVIVALAIFHSTTLRLLYQQVKITGQRSVSSFFTYFHHPGDASVDASVIPADANLHLQTKFDQPSQLIVTHFDQKDGDFELLHDETFGILRTRRAEAGSEHGRQLPKQEYKKLQTPILAKGAENAVSNSATIKETHTQTERQNPHLAPYTVWIIGDSLTRGLFASSEATTFRNLLFSALRNKHPGEIHSTFWAGVGTLGGLEQQWDQFVGLPDLIFIELGINDLGRNPALPQVPVEEWQARYGAMLDRIQQDAPGVKIIVGTVPWSGWPSNYQEYQLALRYNRWITTEAQKRDITVADLWTATVGKEDGLSTPDQLSAFPPHHGDNFHPNDLGHQRIANTFFNAYVGTLHSTYLPWVIGTASDGPT